MEKEEFIHSGGGQMGVRGVVTMETSMGFLKKIVINMIQLCHPSAYAQQTLYPTVEILFTYMFIAALLTIAKD